MAQFNFGNLSSPLSGADFIDNNLEPWRDALHSNHSGSSAPSYIAGGMIWIDTTTTPWVINIYDGAQSVSMGTLNATTHVFTPSNIVVADSSITTAKLNDGAVTTIKIGDSQVTTAKIADNNVTTVKIADNNITLAKLATQAANTVLANATASTAVPTAVALSTNQIIGRLASNIVAIDLGTAAQFRANTADKILVTDDVWSASAVVALTDASTIAVDLSTGINFSVTLTTSRILGNPSNVKDGQAGYFKVTQPGGGGAALTYAANWKGTSGITLSTAGGAVDVVYYSIVGSTPVITGIVKGI